MRQETWYGGELQEKINRYIMAVSALSMQDAVSIFSRHGIPNADQLSKTELKSKFRKWMTGGGHPDLGGSVRSAQDMNSAYDILSGKQRPAYSPWRSRYEPPPPPPPEEKITMSFVGWGWLGQDRFVKAVFTDEFSMNYVNSVSEETIITVVAMPKLFPQINRQVTKFGMFALKKLFIGKMGSKDYYQIFDSGTKNKLGLKKFPNITVSLSEPPLDLVKEKAKTAQNNVKDEAQTIIKKLGGLKFTRNKLVKNLVRTIKGIKFDVSVRDSKSNINRIQILANPKGLYNITFYNYSARRREMLKLVSRQMDVPFDYIAKVLADTAGLKFYWSSSNE